MGNAWHGVSTVDDVIGAGPKIVSRHSSLLIGSANYPAITTLLMKARVHSFCALKVTYRRFMNGAAAAKVENKCKMHKNQLIRPKLVYVVHSASEILGAAGYILDGAWIEKVGNSRLQRDVRSRSNYQ